MKVYKKELPKNVRKMFKYEKGVKVKVLNSLYYGKKKQKQFLFLLKSGRLGVVWI